MDTVWEIVTSPFRIPENSPSAGAVLTGLAGLILAITGLVVFTEGYAEEALVAFIPGLILLAFVVYAAAETSWFQHWRSPDPGHLIARWIGPSILGICFILIALAIIVSIGAIIVMIFIAIAALGGS